MPEEQPTPQRKALCPVHKEQMPFIHTWDGRHWFECGHMEGNRRCSCKIDYPAAPKTPIHEQP